MGKFCVIENDTRLSGIPKYISITGNFNCYVSVELKRKPGTTNSSITVNCFTKEDRKIAIAAKLKWFQGLEGKPQSNRQINLLSNFYQVSPRDINRVITIMVFPFEDGYDGKCEITYGPIKVDKRTHKRLSKALKDDFLEIMCKGRSSRTSAVFKKAQADSHELQFYGENNNIVETHRITKDMTTHPAMIDSLQMRVISPSGDVNLKTESHDDRDTLMLFLQYHIKKKGGNVRGSKMPNSNTLNHSDFFNNTHFEKSFLRDSKPRSHVAHKSGVRMTTDKKMPYSEQQNGNVVVVAGQADNSRLNDSISQDLMMFNNAESNYRGSAPLYVNAGKRRVGERSPSQRGTYKTAGILDDSNIQDMVNNFKKENEQIKIKNAALLREIDFLNKQRNDLMNDSFARNEAENMYKDQVNHLSEKVKEYRQKAKELEKALIDTEKKRVEIRKQLDGLEYSNMENKTNYDAYKSKFENLEKTLQYYQKRNEELEKVLNEERHGGRDLKSKADKVKPLEKLVKNLEKIIDESKNEKLELCNVVADMRKQLNEQEDLMKKAKNDEKLANEKLKILMNQKGSMNQRIKELEGLYQTQHGKVSSAMQLTQKTKKLEMDLELANTTIESIKREKQELVMLVGDLREQLNHAEDKADKMKVYMDGFKKKEDLLTSDSKANHERLKLFKMQMEDKIKDIEDQKGDSSNRVNELENQKKMLENDKQMLEDALRDVAQRNKDLEKENDDLMTRLEENVDRLQMYQNISDKQSGKSSQFLSNGMKSFDFGVGGDNQELWNRVKQKLVDFDVDVPDTVNIYNVGHTIDQALREFKDKEDRVFNLESDCHDLRAEKIELIRQLGNDHSHEQKVNDYHDQELKDLQLKIEDLNGQVEYLDEENARLKKQARSRGSAFDKFENDVKQKIDKSMQDLRKQNNQLLSDKNQLQNKTHQMTQELQSKTQELQSKAQELQSKAQELSKIKSENQTLKGDKGSLETKIQDLQFKVQVKENENKNLQKLNENLKKQNAQIQEQSKQAIKMAETNINKLKEKADKELGVQIENLRNRLENEQEKVEILEEENKRLKIENVSSRHSNVKNMKEFDKKNNYETTIMRQRIMRLESEVNDLQQENLLLQERNNNLNQSKIRTIEEHQNNLSSKELTSNEILQMKLAIEDLNGQVEYLDEENKRLKKISKQQRQSDQMKFLNDKQTAEKENKELRMKINQLNIKVGFLENDNKMLKDSETNRSRAQKMREENMKKLSGQETQILKKTIESLKQQIEFLENENQRLEDSKIGRMEDQYMNSGRSSYKVDQQDQIDKLTRRISELEGEIEYLDEENNRMRDHKMRSRESSEMEKINERRVNEMKEEIKLKDMDNKRLRQELDQLRSQNRVSKDRSETMLDRIKKENMDLKQTSARLELENQSLRSQALGRSRNMRRGSTESDLDLNKVKSENLALKNHNKNLESKINTLQKINEDKDDALFDLENLNREKDKKIDELEGQNRDLKNEVNINDSITGGNMLRMSSKFSKIGEPPSMHQSALSYSHNQQRSAGTGPNQQMQIQNLKTRIRDLENQLELSTSQVGNLRSRLALSNPQSGDSHFTRRIEELEKELYKAKIELQESKGIIADLREKIRKLEEKHLEVNTLRPISDHHSDELNREKDEMIDKLSLSISKANQEITNLKYEIEERERQIEELADEKDVLLEQLTDQYNQAHLEEA